MIPGQDTPDTQTTAQPSLTPIPKLGFTSSEFALTAASTLAFVLGQVPQQYAPEVAGIVALYTAVRALVKCVHAMGYARAFPDLPSLPTQVGSQPSPNGE